MTAPLKRFWPYVKQYRPRFIQAFAAMAVVAGLQGASVYLIKPIIDEILVLKQYKWLITAVILLPSFFFLKMIASYTQAYLMSWVGQKTAQRLREELFRHLHELSVEFYWKKRTGEIMAKVTNDLSTVQSALQFLPLYFIRDTLTLAVLMFILFYTHWKFALLALLTVPMAGVILFILGKKMRDSSLKSQTTVGHIYHRFQESLQGMTIVKAFNYEQGAISKFIEENDTLFNHTMRYLRATALSGPLMEFVGSLVLTLLLYYGGREILADKLTPGEFFAFLGSFFAAYGPLKNIANANSTLQLALASWGRILQLLDEKPTVVVPSGALKVDRLDGDISFKDVWYRYPGARSWALRGINIDISKGNAVAFVGLSGSGKTTLVHLLLRLFDPQKGSIFYDGRDLKVLDLKDLRNHIGLVTQSTVLFDDSVFNNIALGRPDAAMDEVAEAGKTADAHVFIEQLPLGYYTSLGERGVKLSGGQRQRLAIARAILKKPSVLILDEATSNLDSSSEKAVQSALEKLHEGRTVVMVAHRLSTVQNADRIYVLHHGQIAEAGSHAELLERNGIYRRLWEMQSGVVAEPEPGETAA